ncbi:MAG: AAA family ATPase [Erysipelotrichaceae bacterium]|nr:AAA family ATPase [Erysipelotrichaceae bacterium]
MKALIILISGAPGTGKSTIAGKVMERYPDLELLSYDALKEVFWERYGFDNKEEKEEINRKSLLFFYEELERMMRDRKNIISEYPFYQRHRETLKNLIEQNDYQCISVMLYGDRHLIYEREKRRNRNYSRHPAHVLNRYHKEDFTEGTKVEPIVYSEEEFWKMIEHKDYSLNLGRQIDIDVTDYDKIDLTGLFECIREMKEESHEQAD